MDGLSDSDVQSVANYVFQCAVKAMPYLTALELYESTGNGVIIGDQCTCMLPLGS